MLWGLCDGASAALMYAPGDERVQGLVLLNPWVRSTQGLAQSYLRTYYPRRIVSAAFWRKVLRDPLALVRSAAGLVGTFWRSRVPAESPGAPADFRSRMVGALAAFRGHVLLLLSGNDLTAGEFKALVEANTRWQALLGRDNVRRMELSEANHTFSSHEWRSWVFEQTVQSVRTMESREA
jgi:exosortase A-associated hydrolase 1